MGISRIMRKRAFLLAALAALAVGGAANRPTAARGDEPLRETTSLGLIPEDAAVYCTRLKLRDQWQRLRSSRAAERLIEHPAVQLARVMVIGQWNNPEGWPVLMQLRALLENPENQQLVELACDAVSQEVFFYLGKGYASQLGALMELSRAINVAQFEALAEGEDPQEHVKNRLLKIVVHHAESFAIPETAVGFRLSDTQAAQRQIARLHAALVAAVGPETAQRVELAPEGSFPQLTVRLDGTLLPLDAMRSEMESEVDPETVDKLMAAVSKLEVTLGVGVKQGCLVLFAASDPARLKALGRHRSLLERAEAAPLRQAANRPLTSITYISEELLEDLGGGQRQIDDMVRLFQSMVPLAELGVPLQDEIRDDLSRFGEELKRYVPRPGATLAFTCMTDRGYEGWSYTWVENTLLDDSAPLSILDHVGGSPMFVIAFRGRQIMERYDFTSQWLERLWHHLRRIAFEKAGAAERATWEKIEPQVTSLLETFRRIARETIMPSLSDGQCALVIDAGSTSRRWHAALAETDDPLPMLEVALVHSVSDADRFGRGCEELFHAAREGLLAVHRAAPDDVPEIELPFPSSMSADTTSIHYFPFPVAWGIDRQLAPSAGWTEGAAALSLAPQHIERLLRANPFTDEGPVSLRGRRLAAAAQLDWTRLVDAARPWIDYAVEQAWQGGSAGGQTIDEAESPETSQPLESPSPEENPAVTAIKDQIHQVLDLIRCFRGFRSATYFDEGVQVTHFECRFQDVQR